MADHTRDEILRVMRSYLDYRDQGDPLAIFKLANRWNLLCETHGSTPQELAELFPDVVAYVFKTMGDWYAEASAAHKAGNKPEPLGRTFDIEKKRSVWALHWERLGRERAQEEWEALELKTDAAAVEIAERHGLLSRSYSDENNRPRLARRKLARGQ